MDDKRDKAVVPPPPDTSTRDWWVDVTGTEGTARKPLDGDMCRRFFRSAEGYQQEVARDRLTDNNLKVLRAALPEAGQWGYLRLAERRHPSKGIARIKSHVKLPPYARAVIVDSGRAVRLLVTGDPPYERLLEVTLGGAPSFDCWIGDEWVQEEVFETPDRALRALRRYIRTYLSPEAVAQYEESVARV